MTNITTNHFKFAAAGIMAFSALTGLLAPLTASAALVTGNAAITIDNSAIANATGGWIVDRYFDASYNTTAIGASTAGGSSSVSNMLFSVNTNTSTVFYGNPPNRYLESTTMDVSNTASGQIGLSGAMRMSVAGDPNIAGNLTPYDFTLQKFGGTWNLISHDFSFGATTFLQLINALESVDSNGQLSLSGDLIFGGGVGPTTSPNKFGLTWGSFLSANPSLVVGKLNLAPVPVPAAVWMFGSGLLGLLGAARRKKRVTA